MRRLSAVVAVVALLGSVRCGGGGSPSAPAPQPFNQTVTGTVGTLGITQHPLTTPRAGNMTVTLTWQTTADLDLYLTNGTCNQYPPDSCQILAQSDRFTGSSETITRTVAAGEVFKLWIDNFALAPQNYTLHTLIQ
jgi:hypothetical protein